MVLHTVSIVIVEAADVCMAVSVLLEVFLGVDCSDWCRVAEELLCCQLVAYCVRLVLVEVVTELYLCLTVTTDIQQTLLLSSTI